MPNAAHEQLAAGVRLVGSGAAEHGARPDPGSSPAVDGVFRQVFEVIPDGVLVCAGGCVSFANGAAARIYGATRPEELIDRSIYDLVHPDSHDGLEARLGRDAVPETFTALGVRLDGRFFDSESSLVSLPWAGGPACLVVVRDVSARLEAEAALREKEERFSLAVEGSNDGIWDWNIAADETYQSPRLKQMLGYAEAELPDDPGGIEWLIHPDDVGENRRRLEEHLDGRSALYEAEIRMRHRDGGYRWVYVRGKAIRDPQGRPRRIAGTYSDIDARKQAEAERAAAEARALKAQAMFQDALEATSDGFAVFDADDRLIFFNQKYKDSHPALPGLIREGLSFTELMCRMIDAGLIPEAKGREDQWLAVRLDRHRNPPPPKVIELLDGRWVQITERRTADGGTVIVRSDITELKKAEKALQTRVEELEHAKLKLEEQSEQLAGIAGELKRAKEIADAANRTKSEFLANMSHELRTPLNAIIGFSEVIKNQMFGPVGLPQYAEYATDIYNSGAHLLEIINDILDISKVEAGKFQLAEERIDVARATAAVMRLIKGRAEAGGVHLRQKLPRELPWLHADNRALKQMLLNLLSNAIKFTPRAGRVELRAELDAAGGVCLVVADTGIGIEREDFAKVLSPFGQVDTTLSREYDGTGLGLPLVRALIELHGGRLELESEVGVGTTVTLVFPPERALARPAG